jgi:hypothetical protein
MFKKTSIRLELAIGLNTLQGYNALMLAGWFIKCSLSTFAHQFTKKKEAKKKSSNSSSCINKIMNTNLKAGLDVQTSAVCIAVLLFGLDGILLGF